MLFQVLWLGQPEPQASWITSTSLPPSLVDEYESGIAAEANTEIEDSYGQFTNTICVVKRNEGVPYVKKPRKDRPVLSVVDG